MYRIRGRGGDLDRYVVKDVSGSAKDTSVALPCGIRQSFERSGLWQLILSQREDRVQRKKECQLTHRSLLRGRRHNDTRIILVEPFE